MQVDSKNNLILNIKNKTQIYSTEEVKKALEDYEKNKIATNQVSFCANHDRDTQEAIVKNYIGAYPYEERIEDPIVKAVTKDLLQRSQVGIKKYGVTLDRNDLSLRDWVTHVYEELLDACNYLKKVSIELDKKENNTLLETHEMD